MNRYQMAAILVVRMVGCALALIGLVGPLSVAVMTALGQSAPSYPSQRYVGSLIWLIGGVVLVVVAKPIGRRLGSGLE